MSELKPILAQLGKALRPTAILALSIAVLLSLPATSQARDLKKPMREASIAPSAEMQSDSSSDYRLGSGDKVRISVFNQKDMTDVYQVDGLGRIAFPLIGQIDAGGLTPKQLEQKLMKALSPDYVRNPHVSVVVLTARPFYILGEVTKPGSYPYVSGMTVLTAAAQAGGFTYRARESSFDLQRTDQTGRKKTMEAKPDTPVQPGDVITVNERFF
jgi:polysaccharide export outer membrane protein